MNKIGEAPYPNGVDVIVEVREQVTEGQLDDFFDRLYDWSEQYGLDADASVTIVRREGKCDE